MMTSKWTVIAIVGIILAAILGNLPFWKKTLGFETESLYGDEGGDGERAEGGDASSTGVMEASAVGGGLGGLLDDLEGNGGQQQPHEVTPNAGPSGRNPDHQPPIHSGGESEDVRQAFQNLANMFSKDGMRRGGPKPESLTRFHSEAEVLSGMTMQELMKAAHALRKKAKGGGDESGGDEGSGNEGTGEGGSEERGNPAPTSNTVVPPEEEMAEKVDKGLKALADAQVDTIIVAGKWSVCRIGGHRLRRGQKFPGTSFKVTEITRRAVVLSDGTSEISKELAAVRGSGKTEDGSDDGEPAPGGTPPGDG
ncbi:MAG: hypothetical protein CMJ83_17805 [Planctomycetes bacterium]|nr:hypothetical protein [Planctomycetota bacterium]